MLPLGAAAEPDSVQAILPDYSTPEGIVEVQHQAF